MNWIRQIFVPPTFDDPEETRVAFLTHWIIVAHVGALVLISITVLAFGGGVDGLVYPVSALVLLAASGAVLRLGYVSTSAFCVVLSLLLVVVARLLSANGLHDISIVILPVIVCLAALLLALRLQFAILAAVILCVGLVTLADMSGWTRSIMRHLTGVEDFIIVSSVLTVLSVSMGLMSHQLLESLRDARRSAVDLQASVGALREEVAERLRAQAEIAALNAELEQRVKERTHQLENANRELRAFTYSVSHDLRSPLRAIEGFAQILTEDHAPSLSSEGRRALARVVEGTRRMSRLVEDLLAFARLNREPLNRKDVDVAGLVRTVLDEVLPEQRRDTVRLVVGELPPCKADPTLLRQVWTNLIGNAVKYSSKTELPMIEIGHRDGVYFVRDNGVGFDMRYADRLFGVFQRLHSEQEFEGTGVGLASTRRIVHRHGGEIWAEGEVNRGARFSFRLPDGPLPELSEAS